MKKAFSLVLCLLLVTAVFPAASFAVVRNPGDDFESYILSQLEEEATAIDISSYHIASDEITDLYFDILHSHPELFYVERHVGYSYMDHGRVTVIEPSYLYTGQDRRIKSAQFEMMVTKIAEYASAAESVIGQLMLANDFFCANFEFDISDTIHDPYTLFMDKTGVCDAYALAFGAVLNELGIPNTYVRSEKMNHAWNMVQIDDDWYHIDVTWNDPVEDMPLRARHDYFLLSDAAMKANGYYAWDTDLTAENTRFDSAFWLQQKTPIPVYNNHLIYADAKPDKEGNRNIHAWNPETDETKTIGFTSVYGFDGNGKYAEGYSAIFTHEGSLYYASANCIYRLEEDGSSTYMYSNADADQMIWSAWVQNGDLLILTGKDIKGDVRVKTLIWE